MGVANAPEFKYLLNVNTGNLLIAILIVATSLIIWRVWVGPFKPHVEDLAWPENMECDTGFVCGTMPRDPQEL